MKNYIFTILLSLSMTLLVHAKQAADGWLFSTYMGASVSMENQVAFHFEDRSDQVFKANWRNRSFTDSHWWSAKLDRWNGDKVNGFELIHHKIYLANPNDVVQSFSISDGYNLFYYNFGRKFDDHILRLGLGVIFAHPDVQIQGRDHYIVKGTKGHHLAGPTVQLGYERWLWDNETNFVSLDTKLTFSYAKSPISPNRKEYAVVPDVAFHISIGVGNKPQALAGTWQDKAKYAIPFFYPYVIGNYFLGTGLLPSGD